MANFFLQIAILRLPCRAIADIDRRDIRMVTPKPHHTTCRLAALITAAIMALPTLRPATADASDLAQRETQRRSANVSEAMELLRKGDEAYLDADYRTAVEAFSGALELIPNAPATAEVRQAATERLVTATVEHARTLSRNGDVPGAITAVEGVLAPEVAPQHPAARRMLAELQDPIRTNPALTQDHAANVDEVRRLLYTAEGAYNLGKFDDAHGHYEAVLRIDPHNRAARRGMERVAARKSDYARTGYDDTRARMLAEVAAQWELPVPMVDEIPAMETGVVGPNGARDFLPVASKINRIIIPTYNIEQATLPEALELLRVRAREFDTMEVDPLQRGVNINLILGNDEAAASDILSRRINLRLSNVNVAAILGYLCDMTATGFSIDDFSVVVRPLASHRDEMITRTFRVPPDFLASLTAAAGDGGSSQPADIFAPTPQRGLLPQRLGIREALVANGIEFPEGASVNISNNLLRVTHTAAAMELVEQLVNMISESEPISVVTRVTIMRVQESRLNELGYDWLLGSFKIGGGGGDFLGINGGTGGSFSDLDPILVSPNMNPITAGNRSGGQAISPDFISGVINDTSQVGSSTRAPGVLSISGVMNNTTAQMVLRGLNLQKGFDVMNQPSVVTRSGQTTSIRVVREFIYPTEYEPPEVPQTVNNNNAQSPITPATPSAFESRDTGTLLEVLPVADSTRNYIDLTIAPNVTDFVGFINYGSPINAASINPITGSIIQEELTPNQILQPIFSVNRLNTQVTVADGATLVLGGLLSSAVENVEDQTPILGDLPIVGRFFRSTANRTVRTAVLFFVNVELIDATGRPIRDR